MALVSGGSGGNDIAKGGGDERDSRLRKANGSLMNGLEDLEDAHRTASETTALTDAIQGELVGNRQIIIRSRGFADETLNNLNKSEAIINALRHGDIMKKLILLSVAILLFCLDFVVLWYKLKRII